MNVMVNCWVICVNLTVSQGAQMRYCFLGVCEAVAGQD